MTDQATFLRLSAYLDNELSEHERRTVEALLRRDPDAAATMAELQALQIDMLRAFASEPTARLDGGATAPTVAPPLRRRHRGGRALTAGAALAASVLIGVWVAQEPSQDRLERTFPDPASSAIAAIFETARTGEIRRVGDATIIVMGTFVAASGAPCREFERSEADRPAIAIGLGCREPSGEWRIASFDVNTPERAADGRFRPASSGARDDVGALLERLGAGRALSPKEEARLISSTWSSSID